MYACIYNMLICINLMCTLLCMENGYSIVNRDMGSEDCLVHIGCQCQSSILNLIYL